LLDVLEVLRRHRLEIAPEIAMYLKALIAVVAVAETLAPMSEVHRIQKKFYRRMLSREIRSFIASEGP
jgi:hypothetical protein